MIASGGRAGDLSLARLVSRRPFTGYWEYHIDTRTVHRAAARRPLRRRRCSMPTANCSASARWSSAMPRGPGQPPAAGNMFVPVDLLRPILAELRDARRVGGQPARLARRQLRRARGRGAGGARDHATDRPTRPACCRATRSSRSTVCRCRRSRCSTRRCGAASRPNREVQLEIVRDGTPQHDHGAGHRPQPYAAPRARHLSRALTGPRARSGSAGAARVRTSCGVVEPARLAHEAERHRRHLRRHLRRDRPAAGAAARTDRRPGRNSRPSAARCRHRH